MSAVCTPAQTSTGQPLIEKHPKTIHFFGRVVLSNAPGNYAAGGDVLDLNGLLPPGYNFPSNGLPEKVEIQSIKSPGATSLFVYNFALGTTMSNGKIQVFTGAAAQSGLAELANGNYPAVVLADVIEIEVVLTMS